VSFSTNCCIEASFIGLVVRDAISSWVSVQCIRSVWGAWRMHALISILCGIPKQHARPGKHINLSRAEPLPAGGRTGAVMACAPMGLGQG